jgi:glycosyltransferase involved in cell wall biosynthesis
MIKIALITDTSHSAIWRLASMLKLDGFEYKATSFHPKKPSPNETNKVKELFQWADYVHIQYWKSGAKIRELFPKIWNSKPKLLTHYNPYNLHEESWDDYIKLVVVNKTQQAELPQATLIPLCTDVEFFTFNPNYTTEKVVNMTVNRIEGKKGVKEVAQICEELGYKFLLVGRPSKPQYVNDVLKFKCVEYKQNVTDAQLVENYYKSTIHVCNSVPNFETGTLPVLESMACGVPVITRNVGHAPDMYNGKNFIMLDSPYPDVEELKSKLKSTMEDRDLRMQMREEGRKTAESRGRHVWRKNHGTLYNSL